MAVGELIPAIISAGRAETICSQVGLGFCLALSTLQYLVSQPIVTAVASLCGYHP